MNISEADTERARLDHELRLRQQEMKSSVHELSNTVRRVTTPPAAVQKMMPLLPYVAVLAVGGYLMLRLRGRGPKLGVMLPMAIELWRTGLAVSRMFAAPVPHQEALR